MAAAFHDTREPDTRWGTHRRSAGDTGPPEIINACAATLPGARRCPGPGGHRAAVRGTRRSRLRGGAAAPCARRWRCRRGNGRPLGGAARAPAGGGGGWQPAGPRWLPRRSRAPLVTGIYLLFYYYCYYFQFPLSPPFLRVEAGTVSRAPDPRRLSGRHGAGGRVRPSVRAVPRAGRPAWALRGGQGAAGPGGCAAGGGESAPNEMRRSGGAGPGRRRSQWAAVAAHKLWGGPGWPGFVRRGGALTSELAERSPAPRRVPPPGPAAAAAARRSCPGARPPRSGERETRFLRGAFLAAVA